MSLEEKQLEKFKVEIMSLDKSKFHFICLQTESELKDVEVGVQQLQEFIQNFGVEAVILPYAGGSQIDIQSVSKEQFELIYNALVKTKEREDATATVA